MATTNAAAQSALVSLGAPFLLTFRANLKTQVERGICFELVVRCRVEKVLSLVPFAEGYPVAGENALLFLVVL